MPTKKIRFAVLIRVSTDKQEKQGESLLTQQTAIEDAVEQLGGAIARKYAGQEHATSGWEREQLDKLLTEAASHRKPFDAVMVYEPTRWSRDNAKSKEGLDILRSNGIRFFTLTQEQDLFDPTTVLYLGMSAEIGEYQSRMQKLKSAQSCIARAKRIGAPTSGKPPFGRIWDKKAERWSVDEKKKEMIENVAQRYLAGEPMPRLAKEVGLNHTTLHKTLTRRCGDSYQISWDMPDLNIKETVKIKIPRLLPDETIKAIKQKAEANRTYEHGKYRKNGEKNPYLLSGMIFCAKCGYSMFGQTNSSKHYRHAHTVRARQCDIEPRPWVRADDIEDAVMRHLFEMFGNPDAVARALERAVPNRAKIAAATKEYESLNAKLKQIERSRERILELVVKETISATQTEKKLLELKQREELLLDQLEQAMSTLDHVPNAEGIRTAAGTVARVFRGAVASQRARAFARDAKTKFELMTWDDKRSLAETVFNGRQPDGRPCGVYIEKIDGQATKRRKQWAFTIRGIAPVDGNKLVTRLASG